MARLYSLVLADQERTAGSRVLPVRNIRRLSFNELCNRLRIEISWEPLTFYDREKLEIRLHNQIIVSPFLKVGDVSFDQRFIIVDKQGEGFF